MSRYKHLITFLFENLFMKLRTIILFSFYLVTNSYLHGADAGKNDTPQEISAVDIEIAKRQRYIEKKLISTQDINGKLSALKQAHKELVWTINNERRIAIRAGDDNYIANGISITLTADYEREAREKHAQEMEKALGRYQNEHFRLSKALGRGNLDIRRQRRRIRDAESQLTVPASVNMVKLEEKF